MATVLVNGKEVEIGANERLNCIQAAAKVGEEIPAYFWHPELSVVASCRTSCRLLHSLLPPTL
mgnify:CR=1 FL=1